MDCEGEIVMSRLGWVVRLDHPPRRVDMMWLAPSGKIYVWEGDHDGWVQCYPAPVAPVKEIQHG